MSQFVLSQKSREHGAQGKQFLMFRLAGCTCPRAECQEALSFHKTDFLSTIVLIVIKSILHLQMCF